MGDALTITNVVVPVDDGVAPFELGVACELFGLDRTDQGLPGCSFALASVSGGPVRTTAGFTIDAESDLERMDGADLVCLVAGSWAEREPDPVLRDRLIAAHRSGAHIMAICRGAFLLARTGLLDHRRAATHWRWIDEFERTFPSIDVDRDALYVDEGSVSTSAGTAAGIDLGIHLLRRAHGTTVATEIARRMVVSPHREGGQAQYVSRPVNVEEAPTPILDALSWALGHLDRPIDVSALARRANMAPRSFARAVTESQGITPGRWLVTQRIQLARQLLESTDATISHVARMSGFGSDTVLRDNFHRHVGSTPSAYRTSFRLPALAADLATNKTDQ